MKNKIKTAILVLAILISIVLAYFLFSKEEKQVSSEVEYTELIKELNEVISTLQENIAVYQDGIEEMSRELAELKKQLDYARKEHKKTDADILNGDADFNFRFLSDFLSEDDN